MSKKPAAKKPEEFACVNKRTLEIEFNTFDMHDGHIDHYINGIKRATVPLEHWADYALAVASEQPDWER